MGSPTTESRLLRADLHTHTAFSPDSRTSPAELVERAAELGLDRVAVTDHGEMEGARIAQTIDPERVIVGEEIRCRGRTEIIGLYLTDWIPPNLRLEEVVERIRDQGGVVYAPHPFAYVLRPGWQARRAASVADVVEVFNSRAFLPAWNRSALQLARQCGRPAAASSDAHRLRELGRGFTLVPPFHGPSDFLLAIGEGRPVAGELGSPFIHLVSAWWKLARAVGVARAGSERSRLSRPVPSSRPT
jgi:predicted metal-dependent phosphoesterase TrpH